MACMKLNCIIQCVLVVEFLLFPSLTPLHFMAQGREFSPHTMMRGVIGSRPPRCDNERCKPCGRCVAVQVPVVVPRKEFFMSYFHAVPRINIIAYSRGDYISNYKRMSWKCKCGDSIFNP